MKYRSPLTSLTGTGQGEGVNAQGKG
jgi:hypothetical protein